MRWLLVLLGKQRRVLSKKENPSGGTSVIVSYKDGYARRDQELRAFLLSYLFSYGQLGVLRVFRGLFVSLVLVFFCSCLFWSRCFISLCHALNIRQWFLLEKVYKNKYTSLFFEHLKILFLVDFQREKNWYTGRWFCQTRFWNTNFFPFDWFQIVWLSIGWHCFCTFKKHRRDTTQSWKISGALSEYNKNNVTVRFLRKTRDGGWGCSLSMMNERNGKQSPFWILLKRKNFSERLFVKACVTKKVRDIRLEFLKTNYCVCNPLKIWRDDRGHQSQQPSSCPEEHGRAGSYVGPDLTLLAEWESAGGTKVGTREKTQR